MEIDTNIGRGQDLHLFIDTSENAYSEKKRNSLGSPSSITSRTQSSLPWCLNPGEISPGPVISPSQLLRAKTHRTLCQKFSELKLSPKSITHVQNLRDSGIVVQRSKEVQSEMNGLQQLFEEGEGLSNSNVNLSLTETSIESARKRISEAQEELLKMSKYLEKIGTRIKTEKSRATSPRD